MRFTRKALGALTAAALVSLGALTSTAMAAAPANDTFAGATAVSLGFSQVLDTTEATTDALDKEANAQCGAPATDASVWYSYTAPTDGGVVVAVADSDYSAGAIVVSGSPGAFTLEACGPRATGFFATAGTTYYILAIDDQFDGGGNGGTLRISIDKAPPPPTIDVTVDPTGYVDGRTGVATIHGTLTCTDAQFVDMATILEQRIGVRATVTGIGFFSADGSICDGSQQPWTTQVAPDGGKFAGGKTASFTYSFACGPFQCSEGYSEQTVKLRGGKK